MAEMRTMDDVAAWYAGLAIDDPVRYEFEAFVYQRVAYACARKADQIHAAEARRSAREPRT